jgi:hypothetical protein
MEAHRSFRNGQAQTNPASLPAASIVQAVKGLEQLFQRIGGNAIAAIRDSHHRLHTAGSFRFLQMDCHCRAFAGVTDGIAHNIFDCTMEQGRISAYSPVPCGNFALHVAMPRLGLELRIFGYIEHNFIQQDGRLAR